tara:strand:- start:2 stop:379 length:378 start_codon:yes stop_codon:yes gene_type:complete
MKRNTQLIGELTMFNSLYSAQELQSNFDKEEFKINLSKITDDNINAAFECFTKDEIIERLLADKIWFKLSDRQLHRDCIEKQLSQHNEIMLEVIREATTIKAELHKMALVEVEEIISDYEVNHAS